ncbi:MAG: beta-L-arabinofuranosidase domain-containing protein [Cellvibrio sp.]|uniref:beta-L-arabinofuranosidase domain-containing protein n=1 Tax=Cellvibrio sp. TaxID=1965322 RepID=UPI0031A91394
MPRLSRRQFLNTSCLAACACAAPVHAGVSSSTAKTRTGLAVFEYAQVRLGSSKLLEQFNYQQQLFMGIDDDKLLKPFRSRAGQPAPGDDMGGWYDDSRDFHIDPNDWSTANWHGYIPGHSFGQYVSGLARSYAVTKDARIAKKVDGLVKKYIPTIAKTFFEGYYLPAYTYDKLAIGLIDAYRYVGVVEAKDALEKLTETVMPFLPEKSLTREERRARPYTQEAEIWDEPYTLPENLFLAWQLGMGEQYKAIALRYMQNDSLFDPLAKGISPFKGKHAYSHVNALNSAIQAYLATNEQKYLQAAKNGFAFIEQQSYATGGWGPNEELLAADDTETLFNSLSETHRSFETPCGTYGHFKIARSLMQITKASHYGDSMERVLYNTILGAKPTLPDGSTFYYADYHHDASKFYRGEQWPCCSGTFIQMTADYGISTYLQDEQRLFVNLYVPSQVNMQFAKHDLVLVQETNYPFENSSSFTVSTKKPVAFGLNLRIPAWAGDTTHVVVNGKKVSGAIKRGEFFEISRTWKDKDKVQIVFDMSLRLEPLNAKHAEMVALVFGPLVLFPTNAPNNTYTAEQLLSAARNTNAEWIIKLDKQEVRLKPFMAITDEKYRLYNKVNLTKKSA